MRNTKLVLPIICITGMDSLMAVEIKQALEREYDIIM